MYLHESKRSSAGSLQTLETLERQGIKKKQSNKTKSGKYKWEKYI